MSEISSKVEMKFYNFYRCEKCGKSWEDAWDSMCDDECPQCGTVYFPYKSENIKPESPNPMPKSQKVKKQNLF